MVWLDIGKKFFIIGFLLVANVLSWSAAADSLKNSQLEMVFFDVGQGDAIFIETPEKRQILIDGGDDRTILEKLNQEMPFWDRSLDLVILTHPEHDHLGGLIEVLKNYQVDNIILSCRKDNQENLVWLKLLETKKAKVRLAKESAKVTGGGLVIEMVWPKKSSIDSAETKSVNDFSVVSRLIFGDHSYLFAGDISSKTEKILLAENRIQKTTILKIAHHGSKSSTNEDFLKAASPFLAIISVGANNSYGQPAKEVLERLEKYGIKSLRTDEEGDIKIKDDGKKIIVNTEK